jgi:hypothetical protein
MPNYWAVGAFVQDNDMSEDFIRRGFWFGDAPAAQQQIDDIKVGDRLAMKSRLGRGATEIAIKALGLVTKIERYNAMPFRFLYVDWLDLRQEELRAPFAGLAATIHKLDKSNTIFHL